jgi:hypothetical protein
VTKILVVTSEPLSGEKLRRELSDDEARDAEVMATGQCGGQRAAADVGRFAQ